MTSSSVAITDPVYRRSIGRTLVRFGRREPACRAAPAPLLGEGAEPGPDRIVHDVFTGRREVVVPSDHPGRVAVAEEMAGAAVTLVEPECMDTVEAMQASPQLFDGGLDDVAVDGATVDAACRDVKDAVGKLAPKLPRHATKLAPSDHRIPLCGNSVTQTLQRTCPERPTPRVRPWFWGLGLQALEQLPRFWDVRDFQIARDDRAVPEQPTQQALVELDRTNPREPHRRRPPPQRPVHDEELLRRQHDVRPLPPPDSAHRNHRRDHEQRGAHRSRGPADRDR